MGGGVIGKDLALAIVKERLSLKYQDSPSTKKLNCVKKLSMNKIFK
jgi:hypothetical protein